MLGRSFHLRVHCLSLRFLSIAPKERHEAPFVHLGERIINKGKTCITKPVSDVHLENTSCKKPSFRNVSTNYIFDRMIAKKLATSIAPYHDSRTLFIEVNPGIGCLTAELLNHGLRSLHLIEGNQSFLDYLKMYTKISNQVSISNQRFSYFVDAISLSTLWLDSLSPDRKWESDSQASIFSVIPPRQERFLIPWLVNMISSWHNYGRFKFFFVISDRLYWRCSHPEIATSGNFKHYTVGHILATTLFQIKMLTKVNKSDFVPPIVMSAVEQNAKSKKVNKFEPSKMTLAVIEPRRDLNKVLNPIDCALYAAFVRQLTARRHARLIPTCERLLPGIGLALLDIPEVTSPSTRIGDLKPECFLEIFQIMKRSPFFVPELFLPSTHQQQLANSNYQNFSIEPVVTTSNKSTCDKQPRLEDHGAGDSDDSELIASCIASLPSNIVNNVTNDNVMDYYGENPDNQFENELNNVGHLL